MFRVQINEEGKETEKDYYSILNEEEFIQKQDDSFKKRLIKNQGVYSRDHPNNIPLYEEFLKCLHEFVSDTQKHWNTFCLKYKSGTYYEHTTWELQRRYKELKEVYYFMSVMMSDRSTRDVILCLQYFFNIVEVGVFELQLKRKEIFIKLLKLVFEFEKDAYKRILQEEQLLLNMVIISLDNGVCFGDYHQGTVTPRTDSFHYPYIPSKKEFLEVSAAVLRLLRESFRRCDREDTSDSKEDTSKSFDPKNICVLIIIVDYYSETEKGSFEKLLSNTLEILIKRFPEYSYQSKSFNIHDNFLKWILDSKEWLKYIELGIECLLSE